jgi:6-phosphogluconolactonase
MSQIDTSAQQLLFVGSYAAATEPGIYAFRFDDTTGALAASGSFSGIGNPSFLIVHPNRRWLYAVGETSHLHNGAPGAVSALRFNASSAAIEPINHQHSGGDGPCHLALDATGEWLLASNYDSGSVSVYHIGDDGSLSAATDFIQHQGSSANPERQEGPHAHSATVTPDNRFVIVADLGMDQLIVYALDTSAGKLLPHAQTHTRPGAGPRHIAFHPNGQRVYLGNELDNTVNVYEYDAAGGTLRELQSLQTLPAGAPESYVADIHVSPAGDRVYVSNRGHDSIAVFAAQPDGRLARVAMPSCGGNWPRNFALAPSGRFVLVANEHSDNLAVLPVEIGGAELGAASANASISKPSCVQFVPT